MGSAETPTRAHWFVGAGVVLAVLSLSQAIPVRAGQPAKAAGDPIGLGEGFRLPPFAATDLNGQEHTVTQYEGSVLVLHFWASWCPYCRSEIPELTTLHREWGEKGVRVLTVSTDEDPDELRRFVTQAGLPYPIIADAQAARSLAGQYGISGIPMTFVVARDGRIASRLHGSSEIIQAVERALTQ